MTSQITEPMVRELCEATARELVYLPRTNDRQAVRSASSLVFPAYRTGTSRGKVRVSEAEARAVFLQQVAASPYDLYASVETPTAHKYDFTGSAPVTVPEDQLGGQSAMSDASLWVLADGQLRQDVNVEFKAHNVDHAPIRKDMLKLVTEAPCGLFFHVLQSVDAGTLRNASRTGVLDKYTRAVFEVRGAARPQGWFLVFALCVLGPQRLVALKTMDAADWAGFGSEADVDHFFSTLKVKGRQGAALQNGWRIVPL